LFAYRDARGRVHAAFTDRHGGVSVGAYASLNLAADGDDPAAVAAIAGLVDRMGYEPVRLESLRAGRVLQPGGPVFGNVLTLIEFERAVREDARSLA